MKWLLDQSTLKAHERWQLVYELDQYCLLLIMGGCVLVIAIDLLRNWKSWTKYRTWSQQWEYWGRWYWFFIFCRALQHIGIFAILAYGYFRIFEAPAWIYFAPQ
jgi:hypothetical protein